MKRWRVPVAASLVVALVVGGVLAFVAARRPVDVQDQRVAIAALEARKRALQARVDASMARDPVLSFARQDSSDIAVALSESLLVAIIEEVTTRYLDRIEVHLTSLPGHGEGEFEVDTPFGKMTVGEWKVNVNVREMTGLLSALEPTVSVTGANRIGIALPIRIVDGHGALSLEFAWDSRSVFNVVCRDFKTTQELRGTVLPQVHVIRGDLVLSANEEGIVANPDFPGEKFPISMALSADSWTRVRAALEKEDKLARCGLMVNPDSVVRALHDLGFKGLKFRLPKVVYRSFVLPAILSQSVRIMNAPVQLTVRPHLLRVSPGLFWYSADVDAQRFAGPGGALPLPGGGGGGR